MHAQPAERKVRALLRFQLVRRQGAQGGLHIAALFFGHAYCRGRRLRHFGALTFRQGDGAQRRHVAARQIALPLPMQGGVGDDREPFCAWQQLTTHVRVEIEHMGFVLGLRTFL